MDCGIIEISSSKMKKIALLFVFLLVGGYFCLFDPPE